MNKEGLGGTQRIVRESASETHGRPPVGRTGLRWSLFLVLHTVGVWCHISLKDLDGICQKELSLKIYLW